MHEHHALLVHPDGTVVGAAEAQTMAYAVLVLGQDDASDSPRTPDADGAAVAPSRDAKTLLALGRDAEDAGRPSRALYCYALAAAAGEDSAFDRIRAFGVDPEWLLLGMTSSAGPSGLPRVEPLAVNVLLASGSERTVAVLVERSSSPAALDQVVALGALGELLREADLAPASREAALDAIDAATRDPRPAVRQAARVSMAEASLAEARAWPIPEW